MMGDHFSHLVGNCVILTYRGSVGKAPYHKPGDPGLILTQRYFLILPHLSLQVVSCHSLLSNHNEGKTPQKYL